MFRSRILVGVMAVVSLLAFAPHTALAAKAKAPKAVSEGYIDILAGSTGELVGWAYDDGRPVALLITLVDINDAANRIVLTKPLNEDRPDVTDYLTKRTGVVPVGMQGFRVDNIYSGPDYYYGYQENSPNFVPTTVKPGYFKIESAYFNGRPFVIGAAAQNEVDLGLNHHVSSYISSPSLYPSSYDGSPSQVLVSLDKPLELSWYDSNPLAEQQSSYQINLSDAAGNTLGVIARVTKAWHFDDSDYAGKTYAWDGSYTTAAGTTARVAAGMSYQFDVTKQAAGFNIGSSPVLFTVLSQANYDAASRDQQRLSDVSDLGYAIGVYYQDHAALPAESQLAQLLVPKYLKALPVAPTPADGSCSVSDNQYRYTVQSSTAYTLSYCAGTAYFAPAAGVQSWPYDYTDVPATLPTAQ
jgi:hypothetical protein